jgi:hypothetical protein
LPATDNFEREQLRIYSDIRLPRRHPLIEELVARRRDIADRLLLPLSNEPIRVYVFDNEERFVQYMDRKHPGLAHRRAYFVENEGGLCVFAHWGAHVGEDLRHEVTHGYLHSVIAGMPLWLDEGLAEYFELARDSDGLHVTHISHLVAAAGDDWVPDLQRLESLHDPAEMEQLDYAEAWLWVHFLMESGPEHRKLLQDQLARLRMGGDIEPLSAYLVSIDPEYNRAIVDHLAELARRCEF